MRLSFSTFFRFLFHKKGSYENEDLIYTAIYDETYSKMWIAVIAGAILQMLLFGLSYTDYKEFGELRKYYHMMYIGLFSLMVVSMFILLFIRRDYERHLGKLLWISPIISLLIIVGGMSEFVLDSFANGFLNPVMYMTVILVIPLCVYMHPIVFIAVSLVTDGVMEKEDADLFLEIGLLLRFP